MPQIVFMHTRLPIILLIAGTLATIQAASSQSLQPDSHPAEAALAGGDSVVGTKPHNNTFIIGDDDVLAIDVWKEPEISKSVAVRSDGKISLPLIGEIQATGRTPMELESALAGKLRSYITDPAVTVIVEKINSKKFSILGEVVKPGIYVLASPTTVVDAIAAAGGFRDFAKTRSIYILRTTSDGAQTRLGFNYKDFIKGKNSAQNISLEPRDTVVVP
jgi:polysaccharide export outer membrane protein